MITKQISRVLKRINRGCDLALLQHKRRAINHILKRPQPPTYVDFAAGQLQQRYRRSTDSYGYDAFSTWKRGMERTSEMLECSELQVQRLRVLEIACGDGMTGHALASYGHQVVLNDLEDRRDERARSLPFTQQDICAGLDLQPSSFDFICSFNSFEHIKDPRRALAELIRIVRPGGLIHLHFGPLYASAWGLHAHKTILLPYPQFLFSPEFLESMLREAGIIDLGEKRSELQPLNRWRLVQFDELWREIPCDVVRYRRIPVGYKWLAVIQEFPCAFTGRGLTFEDVSTQAISIWLRKRDIQLCLNGAKTDH